MSPVMSSGILLSKKIWAGVPGADVNGRSDPAATIQYAFGVVPANTPFASLCRADRSVDPQRLIGGVLSVIGNAQLALALAPGQYWLYEFVIERSAAGALSYTHRTGWDFTAAIDGTVRGPVNDDDGAIAFEVRSGAPLRIVGINKSVCVQIDKRYSAGNGRKDGILFFGTSSYLGLTQGAPHWDGSAVVRLGVTDSDGSLRLDGFTSGNNVFIHEVVPQALYVAGMRPQQMEVYDIDGSLWYTSGFPDFHQVSQAELDRLLADPKFTPADHALIREHLHAGDWLFTNQNYLFQRQGLMRVVVTNDNGKKGKLILSKKVWAGVPGSDANGRSDPADTIQYAFGVVPAHTHYGDISKADGSVDESKLLGGPLTVVGNAEVELMLAPGQYWLYEFVIKRNNDGVTLSYTQRTGWDFTAEIDGTLRSPVDDRDGAIAFEVGAATSVVRVAGINKSVSVQIETQFTAGAQAQERQDILFFATSSYRGILPTADNMNGNAIVRLGVTGADGTVRLDGFTSGNNVFIHEVISQEIYDAGIWPISMTVYNLDGALWFTSNFQVQGPLRNGESWRNDEHQRRLTQADVDQLLADPKFTSAGRALIRRKVRAGDYLFSNSGYFFQRQGVLRVTVLNDSGR